MTQTYVHRDFEDKKLKADNLGMRAQACCDELTCTAIADRAMVDRWFGNAFKSMPQRNYVHHDFFVTKLKANMGAIKYRRFRNACTSVMWQTYMHRDHRRSDGRQMFWDCVQDCALKKLRAPQFFCYQIESKCGYQQIQQHQQHGQTPVTHRCSGDCTYSMATTK